MRALVTGAGGLIGSVLCRRLLARGDRVRGLFLPGEPDRGLADLGVEIRRGDITRPETLAKLSDGCDQVFHLAARVEEWGRWSQFRETHYDGTRNMLAECTGKVERFIYFSSVAYYGSVRHLRGVTEDREPVESNLPYPAMKMLCEQLVRANQEERGLSYTIIRPSNVLGARSAHVRNAIDSFSRGPLPLVDGGRYSAALVHVENLVDGVILAADSKLAVNRAYNFCDDYDLNWGEYFTKLGALLGKKPSISVPYRLARSIAAVLECLYMPFDKRPPITRYAVFIIGRDNHLDCTRAKEELGWHTRVSWVEAWREIEELIADGRLRSH